MGFAIDLEANGAFVAKELDSDLISSSPYS